MPLQAGLEGSDLSSAYLAKAVSLIEYNIGECSKQKALKPHERREVRK